MNYILGIDTGGTYTDSVIIDSVSKKILHKRKILTTPQQLRQCIENSFQSIPRAYIKDISMVCLSTTLATNSIVESRGCLEGLILIGSKPNGRIPTEHYALVHGRYDIKGRIQENIDPEEISEVVESFRNKVDAIAISGYASVRNPRHELYVKKVVEDILDIPVVCAHELTSGLGYYERTVTAALNARLIPLIYDLIQSIKSAMAFYDITAPLMIVKGDGNLMSESSARNKPIDTILSGPAASVIGGMHLSGTKDCFVMDIGGTTTDIANVVGGYVQSCNDGAKVGDWFTRVRATEVFTIGIGGDSRIYIDSCKKLQIGPEKSIPLCRASDLYPNIRQELADICINKLHLNFLYNDYEAFVLHKEGNVVYTDQEKLIIEVLRYTPHTLHYLIEHVKLQNVRSIVDHLVMQGILRRISVTPTDLLHATGEYRPWNWVLSELGITILAEQYNMDFNEFIQTAKKTMTEKLERAIVQAAIHFDRQSANIKMNANTDVDFFINHLFFNDSSSNLRATYQLKKKIVAIGASAQVWLKDVGERLDAAVEVPEHSEIANALGAAVGRQIENLDILIRQDTVTDNYIVFSPLDRTTHKTLEESTKYAFEIGEKSIKKIAGNSEYTFESYIENVEIPDVTNDKPIFIERIIHMSAILL